MPYILVDSYDESRLIQQISITCKVDFKSEFWKCYRQRARIKLDELEEKIGLLVKEYFDDYEAEQYSNHEYNMHMKCENY
jgi:hypothetical protein